VGLGQVDIQMKNYKECAVIFDSIDKAPGGIMSKNPTLLYALGTCQQGDHQNNAAKGSYTRLLAFVKPDSQDAKQIKKLIADIGKTSAPAKAKPTPKPSASH
jgi:TolA-binding protein